MRKLGGLDAIALALAPTLVLAAPPPAPAQGAGDPRAFVLQLYAGYQRHGEPDYLGRGAPKVFAPPLLRLLRKEQADAKGEVGLLDADPICSCQDPDGLQVTRLAVVNTAPDRARVQFVLRFSDGGGPAMTLDLVQLRGGWRIADIKSSDLPSLRRLLERGRP